LFAEGARSRILSQHVEAALDGAFRFERPSGAQRRVRGLQPEEAVARKAIAQIVDDAERGIGAVLAVVNEDQREQRVRLRVARIPRGLFDLRERARAAAAESGEMR